METPSTFPTLETRPLQPAAAINNTAHPAVVDVNSETTKRAARWMSGAMGAPMLESDWATTLLLHLACHLYHGEGTIPLPESLRGLPDMCNRFRAELSTTQRAVAERVEREREAARRDPATQLARQLARHDAF